MAAANDDVMELLCGVSTNIMKSFKETKTSICDDIEFWNKLEQAVLTTDKGACKDLNLNDYFGEASQVISLAVDIIGGNYAKVLKSQFSNNLFNELCNFSDEDLHICPWIQLGVQRFVLSSSSDSLVRSLGVMFVGIACLSLFMQANYTGPSIDSTTIADIHPLNFLKVQDKSYRQAASNEEDNNKGTLNNSLHSLSLLSLQTDGDMAYTVCEYPHFLVVAHAFLFSVAGVSCKNWWTTESLTKQEDINSDYLYLISKLKTASWWCARAAVAHERILLHNTPSPTLWLEVQECFKRARDIFVNPLELNNDSSISARVLVEWGLAQHFFDDETKGKHSFRYAQTVSGLSVELTGSLGKRTKFQQSDLAQLVLLASSKTTPEINVPSSDSAVASADKAKCNENEPISSVPSVSPTQENAAAYRTITLEDANPDNILLEEIKFADKKVLRQENLQVIDQVILLALCLDISNSNPKDGLTKEQMIPYVTRVLENPNNWMAYSTGLLVRAWLEYERNHSRERGVLQIQALVDQHTTRLTITQTTKSIEEAAPAEERLEYIYALAFPPRWKLRKGLADRYYKLGILRSALEIYEELGLWDQVIECYRLLEKPKKAEKIVRERLEISPSAFLWCCLGDLTDDNACYLKAWDISLRRYARAKTTLGRKAFYAGDKRLAISHLQDSVAIKSHNPNVWFLLGVALLQVEEWSSALEAFTQVVQQEPDHGEAWGNIGSIHLHHENYSGAYAAFQEGLKHKRHMWQMWENLLLSAMRSNHYGDAIYAMHILLDLRDKHKRPVDHELLSLLVQKIVYPSKEVETDILNEDPLDNSENSDEELAPPAVTPPISQSNYKKQLALLLGRIVANISNNPHIWRIYAEFNEGIGRKDKALDCRLKECRALQTSGWETELEKVGSLVIAAEFLAKAYFEEGSKKSIYACKLFIKGLIKKIERDFEGTKEYENLVNTLRKAEEMEAAIAASA